MQFFGGRGGQIPIEIKASAARPDSAMACADPIAAGDTRPLLLVALSIAAGTTGATPVSLRSLGRAVSGRTPPPPGVLRPRGAALPARPAGGGPPDYWQEFMRTLIVLLAKLAVTMSGRPSWFRSPVVTKTGLSPVAGVVKVLMKAPVPSPP
jgi:hypothetical protein